jgi:hypothetical protein
MTRNEVWYLLSYIRSFEAGRQPSRGELFHVEPIFSRLETYLRCTHGARAHYEVPTYPPSQAGMG